MLCEQRVNLSASAPHAGMPEGNILFWPAMALVSSSGERMPEE